MDYSEGYFKRFKNISKSLQTPESIYIRNIIDNNLGDSYLDIGCGLGGNYDLIKNDYLEKNIVIGLDVSSFALKSAKNKYNYAEFVQADVLKLPFKDNSFNLISALHIIEHLSDTHTFLSELRRALKPGGALVVATVDRDSFSRNLPGVKQLIKDPTHINEFNFGELKEEVGRYFFIKDTRRTSKIYNFGLFNWLLNKILKPDLICIGEKKE